MRLKGDTGLIFLLLLCTVLAVGCAGRQPAAPTVSGKEVEKPPPKSKVPRKPLAPMGYTIQTGAFTRAENAARLTEELKDQGIDATYFAAPTGLFKVRFGNFAQKEDAETVAEVLCSLGVMEEYYLVSPGEYAAAQVPARGEAFLREELIKTARSFIGVPYLWGGTSAEDGFDCSGLTMTVYQLNGLNLPRTSGEQFEDGEPTSRQALQKGDLVFFATAGRGKVSHVGVYIGAGQFIHAPRRGRHITVDSLTSAYYGKRFLGGRSYL